MRWPAPLIGCLAVARDQALVAGGGGDVAVGGARLLSGDDVTTATSIRWDAAKLATIYMLSLGCSEPAAPIPTFGAPQLGPGGGEHPILR